MKNVITVESTENRFEALTGSVRRRVSDILAVLKKDGVAIDVYLVGNRKMQVLNRKWRGKDNPTNVLSFEEPKQFVYPTGTVKRKGEVYLNPEMMAEWPKNAKRMDEFLAMDTLLVHGVLHLFGYDHIEDVDAVKMEKKEASIMKALGKRS